MAAFWGNTINQARALGVLSGPAADARAIIRRVVDLLAYGVHGDEAAWQRADETVLNARSTRVVRRTLLLLPCRTRRRACEPTARPMESEGWRRYEPHSLQHLT